MAFVKRCPVCSRLAHLYRGLVISDGVRMVYFGYHYSDTGKLVICKNSDKIAYEEKLYRVK